MRYPNTARERHEVLQAPTIARTREAVQDEYGIEIGPMGGRKRVKVGVEVTHQHALARHNLALAYAAFAAECPDKAIARYADMAARGRTAQADGKGNKLRAWQDRPRRQRYASHGEPSAPKVRKATKQPKPSNALAICTEAPTHGTGCLCFSCLLA